MYFVYIMTNRSKTLYTGITNHLARRVREHKTGTGSGFTAKYKLDRIFRALPALVVSVNPAWRDLSEEWYERHQYQPQSA